jgi:hypothetical protein
MRNETDSKTGAFHRSVKEKTLKKHETKLVTTVSALILAKLTAVIPIHLVRPSCVTSPLTRTTCGPIFCQFVVPPIDEVRSDCTYGDLPGMKLPDKVVGVHSAMMDCDR